ncbi:MAG TPA: PH domain-containing protein [Longimicrobiaceae bacterium]|nr:PH domain-containing protein [Longimicrobiaceae bacterium]
MPSETRAEALLEAGGKRLHPLTLLFAALGVARQFLFPVVVGGISATFGDWGEGFVLALLVLAAGSLLAAAARYGAFRYRLAGEELVLRTGFVSRQHRVIPLTRVQNVEVRQNLLHRIFGVAELRVETAGGGAEPEASFSVLAEREAQGLRTEVLARRRAATIPAAVPEESEAAAEAPPLVQLSTRDVVLAGATANEVGVIAALAGGAFQFLDDVQLPWLERAFEAVAGGVSVRGAGLALAVLGVLAVVLFVGWIVSIAGALLRYHGFTLHREGGELRKRYGMLTLHEASVPLRRVQALRVEESLLRRPLGLAALMIETAGGGAWQGEQGGAEAFVPLARRAEVGPLVRGIFADVDYDAVRFSPVDPKSLQRAAVRNSVVLLLATSAGWIFLALAGRWPLLLGMLLLPLLAYGLARWEYANRGYALLPGYVVTRSGIMNRVTWIVPDLKLQTLQVRQSPLQRRHGLASLVVDTASGGAQSVVIDLARPRALALMDELTGRMLAA